MTVVRFNCRMLSICKDVVVAIIGNLFPILPVAQKNVHLITIIIDDYVNLSILNSIYLQRNSDQIPSLTIGLKLSSL